MASFQTLNPYFDFYNDTGEKNFYSDFVDEHITLAGTECLYIPKTYAIDEILGEPFQAVHNKFFRIACMLTTPLGYEDGPDIMTQFGLNIKATTKWIMSKNHFRALTIPDRELRPLEGDLLLVGAYASTPADPIFTNHMFEITYVDKENNFWPLGRYYTWALSCELYVASNEKFETGNHHVDDINHQHSNEEEVDLGINDELEDKHDVLLDFDEKNPFGDL